MSLSARTQSQIPLTGMTIDMVDRQLDGGFLLLRFQPMIEHYFEAEAGQDRTRQMVRSAVLGIVTYDLYLAIDWQLLPDVANLATLYRIAIFTPLAGLAAWLVHRSRSLRLRDGITAGFGVLAVAVPMLLFLQSTSPFRLGYFHGHILTMIYAAIMQRVRFRYAVARTVGCLVVVTAAMVKADLPAEVSCQAGISFYVTAALLLLCASYTLERALRRNFLLAVRSGLMKHQLDCSTRLDPLTGLWNRRHLNQTMETAWRESPASGTPMCVIVIDLDHFKLFNDRNGHLAGDDCLRRFSHCLGEVVRGSGADAVRFGGEEFVVFGPGFGLAEAEVTAARVRDAVHRMSIAHAALGPGAIVTASFGIASGRAPETSSAALLAAADAALYQAKTEGRDCIRVSRADTAGGRSAARAVA